MSLTLDESGRRVYDLDTPQRKESAMDEKQAHEYGGLSQVQWLRESADRLDFYAAHEPSESRAEIARLDAVRRRDSADQIERSALRTPNVKPTGAKD